MKLSHPRRVLMFNGEQVDLYSIDGLSKWATLGRVVELGISILVHRIA
jgi:hypothetical protein